MDSKSEAYLEEILKKPMRELTENEKSFLRARRGYLKESQREEYKRILIQTSKKETVKKKHAQTKKEK